MNITELKYIIETASAGSISSAAKSLYVAQPNISKAIKSLEKEYGIQLFERSVKGVVPTREGQKFIRQAERIIDEIEKLDGQFRIQRPSMLELDDIFQNMNKTGKMQRMINCSACGYNTCTDMISASTTIIEQVTAELRNKFETIQSL